LLIPLSLRVICYSAKDDRSSGWPLFVWIVAKFSWKYAFHLLISKFESEHLFLRCLPPRVISLSLCVAHSGFSVSNHWIDNTTFDRLILCPQEGDRDLRFFPIASCISVRYNKTKRSHLLQVPAPPHWGPSFQNMDLWDKPWPSHGSKLAFDFLSWRRA
jgi:hypothetical protein